MLNKFIRNFIAKMVAGRSDDGIMITLTNPKKVDFQAAMLEDLLMRNGFNPADITSERQLKNILNQIDAINRQTGSTPLPTSGIRNTESAKVFEIDTGKEIPKGSKIMGGKAVDDDLPPPGSRGGDDDIAAPVQSSEESLKNMIEAENKKGIAKIKQRQKMLDDAIEDASPGFANDIKYDAELVAENLAERMGLVYDDLPTKQRLDIYDKAYTGLSKQRFKKRPVQRESLEDFVDDAGGVDESDPRGIDDFIPDDDPEPLAKGGIARIGLKDGMNRRTFLKIFSGLVSLPIIGKVLKPLKVGKKVAQVPIIKTGDVPGKPEWFDQLVNKVILEGEDVTKRFATQERQVIHKKKIDDETSVTVTQDLNDGSIVVDVDDPIRNVMGQSGDDTSVQMMLKKNLGDESNPAGPDEFSFTEADMRNYMDGPDDYTTEFTENTVNKMKDLTSDLGKIKSYATGKKPTMKEFIGSKKRKDKVAFAERSPSEYASERGPDIDYSDYDDGMASGGIAGMLGE